jgi:hypothetical protein
MNSTLDLSEALMDPTKEETQPPPEEMGSQMERALALDGLPDRPPMGPFTYAFNLSEVPTEHDISKALLDSKMQERWEESSASSESELTASQCVELLIKQLPTAERQILETRLRALDSLNTAAELMGQALVEDTVRTSKMPFEHCVKALRSATLLRRIQTSLSDMPEASPASKRVFKSPVVSRRLSGGISDQLALARVAGLSKKRARALMLRCQGIDGGMDTKDKPTSSSMIIDGISAPSTSC